MVSKKKIVIPIFDYKLTIVIFDDWEEIKDNLPSEEKDLESRAITLSTLRSAMVFINSRCGSSIVHESGHIKNAIWRYIGYTPMVDNDEVDQYLTTYIYNKIVEVFYRHHNINMGSIVRDTK